jgi:hypothetical protein
LLRRTRIGIAALALTAVAGTTLAAWYQWIYLPPRFSPADPLALAALRSDARVEVTTGRWIVMRPVAGMREPALVFYPGGQVAAEGYAEPLRRVAESGFLVVVVPMPLDLALLAPERAGSVMQEFPEVRRWVIGGHSLGGAMAARFVFRHPARMTGLLLWDAYPADTDDLSTAILPVMQILRLHADGQPPEVYLRTRDLLPESTQFVTLPGGTHMNYGRFIAAERLGKGDPSVVAGSMTVEDQHARVVAATIAFLARAGAPVSGETGDIP